MNDKRICLAQFAGAYGVRGEAKIKCFTAQEAGVASYGPLTSEDGARRFTLTFLRAPKPGLAIVRAPEIKSREDAAALAGVRLFAPRSALPPVETEDEFYIADLVGLDARTDQGRVLGRVVAVHDFGAGDIFEIKRDNSVMFVPFTRSAAPHVDLVARVVTVCEDALREIDATNPDEADGLSGDAPGEQDD